MKKYDIVVISGGFDPVHKGHIRLFKGAKGLGHKVIVGLNSDKWLVNKKGKPFMNFTERSEILNAFQYVDEIMDFQDEDGTAIELLIRIQRLYPKCNIAFANGGDREKTNTPEQGFCYAYNIDMLWKVGGGKVQSSSELISKIKE
tara:strand:+ start:324 stop:758 length:435 start_codon:yes stop_codon:yes gene_type:complete